MMKVDFCFPVVLFNDLRFSLIVCEGIAKNIKSKSTKSLNFSVKFTSLLLNFFLAILLFLHLIRIFFF